MNGKRIIAVIDPEAGTLEWETKGFKGKSCKNITDALTRGKKVVKEEVTSEYYDKEHEFVETGF